MRNPGSADDGGRRECSEGRRESGDGVPIRENRHADVDVSDDDDPSPPVGAMDSSLDPEEKPQEDRSGERSSGAVRKVKPPADKSEEMLEIPDDVPSIPSHSPSPSMENFFEAASSSDDNATINDSYTNILLPEDSLATREYLNFTAKPEDGPPPDDDSSVSRAPNNVAALKKRFEETPPSALLRPITPGVAFHDLTLTHREYFATGKLDAGEVKPSEEVLDIQDPDSAFSLVRKTNLDIGTTRESFQKAKRIFENN